MANNLSASFPEIWARMQQEVFLKKSVAMVIANTRFEGEMSRGDVFHRPYMSVTADDTPDVYTRGSDITIRDITDTDETLTVDKQRSFGFTVDDFDAIQNNYDAAASYGSKYAELLMTQVDADVLYEVVNANEKVDAADVGGSAGQGISLSDSNVIDVVFAARKKLRKNNIYTDNLSAVISPEFEEKLSVYYGDKGTNLGDDVSQNGFFRSVGGFRLHSSNNLTGSAVLALATNPTAGDTVTIQGVTFTFVSSIGTTAGNVLIGANVDATRANLATLINAPSTTTSTGVALSAANARKFVARVTATNNDTANTLTVFYKGAGVLAVSETLTDATDTWTAALIKQHCLFGVTNSCTTLIMQKRPSIQINKVPKQFGVYILNGVLYGVKTFADQKEQMVRIELNASTY